MHVDGELAAASDWLDDVLRCGGAVWKMEEKEDRKWMEEIIQKTIKESVRELNICGGAEQSGTNPPSEDIPDQMMDFLSQMENM